MTDELLHGYQVLLFSRVSEQISRRVRNEVGDAGESLSANWQNIFSSLSQNPLHIPGQICSYYLDDADILCAVASGLEPRVQTSVLIFPS